MFNGRRSHSNPKILPKATKSLLWFGLYASILLVLVNVDVVTSMSLDRLAIERNELQAGDHDSEQQNENNLKNENVVVENDLQMSADPVVGGTADAYVLLPAGIAERVDNVVNNTIGNGGAAQSAPAEENNSNDMVMMETDNEPAMVMIAAPQPEAADGSESVAEIIASDIAEVPSKNEIPKEEVEKELDSDNLLQEESLPAPQIEQENIATVTEVDQSEKSEDMPLDVQHLDPPNLELRPPFVSHVIAEVADEENEPHLDPPSLELRPPFVSHVIAELADEGNSDLDLIAEAVEEEIEKEAESNLGTDEVLVAEPAGANLSTDEVAEPEAEVAEPIVENESENNAVDAILIENEVPSLDKIEEASEVEKEETEFENVADLIEEIGSVDEDSLVEAIEDALGEESEMLPVMLPKDDTVIEPEAEIQSENKNENLTQQQELDDENHHPGNAPSQELEHLAAVSADLPLPIASIQGQSEVVDKDKSEESTFEESTKEEESLPTINQVVEEQQTENEVVNADKSDQIPSETQQQEQDISSERNEEIDQLVEETQHEPIDVSIDEVQSAKDESEEGEQLVNMENISRPNEDAIPDNELTQLDGASNPEVSEVESLTSQGLVKGEIEQIAENMEGNEIQSENHSENGQENVLPEPTEEQSAPQPADEEAPSAMEPEKLNEIKEELPEVIKIDSDIIDQKQPEQAEEETPVQSMLTTILQVPLQETQVLEEMPTQPQNELASLDKTEGTQQNVMQPEVAPEEQKQESLQINLAADAIQGPTENKIEKGDGNIVKEVAQPTIEMSSTTTPPPLNVVDSVLNYVNASFIQQTTNSNQEQQQQQQDVEMFSSRTRHYDGAQVWRIVVQTDKDRKMADDLQAKFDGQLWKEVKQEVDYLLKPQVLEAAEQYVRSANLSRTVLIDNLQKVIEVENPPDNEIAQYQTRNGHRLTWRAYHRLSDIHSYFEYLTKTYPDICSTEIIGYSIQKRPLKILKISNGNSSNPGFWIDGGMHAREWISPATVTYIIHQIVENWEDMPDYMRNVNWYIHAVANPDGYEYSHTTDRLWRKNRRSHGRQCPGVDLNRNFGYKWGGKGTSANPCAQNYRGAKAFSEPETFYISKFISNMPRGTFQAFLSFHSYGQYILYPWGYDYVSTKDKSDLERVARQAGTRIIRSSGNKYTIGSSAFTLYPAAGGSDDWAKGIAGIKYTYTIEMGDTGRYGFVLPASHIEPNGRDGYNFVDTVARAMTQNKDSRRRRRRL